MYMAFDLPKGFGLNLHIGLCKALFASLLELLVNRQILALLLERLPLLCHLVLYAANLARALITCGQRIEEGTIASSEVCLGACGVTGVRSQLPQSQSRQ